ncbi:MAG TPA: hypothetical protein GXZ90_02010 [Clostridiales bacterium]|nr:hypothetical protein [Clostridiales bacterium]
MTYKEVVKESKKLNQQFFELLENGANDTILDNLENEIKELDRLSSIALQEEIDSKIKNITNLNNWTKNFLESFENCKGKKITTKQTEIFKKMLHYDYTKSDFNSFYSTSKPKFGFYSGIYNNKIYELKAFSDCGYLTIR